MPILTMVPVVYRFLSGERSGGGRVDLGGRDSRLFSTPRFFYVATV
jgi:hypothetical protein